MVGKVVEKKNLSFPLYGIWLLIVFVYMFMPTKGVKLFGGNLDLIIIVSFICFHISDIVVERTKSLKSSIFLTVICGIAFIYTASTSVFICKHFGYKIDIVGPLYIILTVTGIIIMYIGMCKKKKTY